MIRKAKRNRGLRGRIARASLVDVWIGLLSVACLIALVRFKLDTSLVILAGAVVFFSVSHS